MLTRLANAWKRNLIFQILTKIYQAYHYQVLGFCRLQVLGALNKELNKTLKKGSKVLQLLKVERETCSAGCIHATGKFTMTTNLTLFYSSFIRLNSNPGHLIQNLDFTPEELEIAFPDWSQVWALTTEQVSWISVINRSRPLAQSIGHILNFSLVTILPCMCIFKLSLF